MRPVSLSVPLRLHICAVAEQVQRSKNNYKKKKGGEPGGQESLFPANMNEEQFKPKTDHPIHD